MGKFCFVHLLANITENKNKAQWYIGYNASIKQCTDITVLYIALAGTIE